MYYQRLLMPAVIALAVFPVTTHAQQKSLQIEEVLVTSQRREESLQDVPISVAAFGAEGLEKFGIDTIADLGAQVPNLSLQTHPTGPSSLRVFIRGIGSLDNQPTQDPPVGVYLNDVFISRSSGLTMDVADLARIEVLRGPQGTLNGRNSVGGAIKLTTVPPDVEALSFKQKFSAGSRDLFTSRTQLNMPLTENTAIKLAYITSSQDGYIENNGPGLDFYDKASEGGRIDFRWLPSDNITVDYAYDFSRNEIGAPTYTAISPASEDANTFGVDEPLEGLEGLFVGFSPNEKMPSSATTVLPLLPTDDKIEGHALNLVWDTDAFTFKSITSYRELSTKSYADLGGGINLETMFADPSVTGVDQTPYLLIQGQPTNIDVQLLGGPLNAVVYPDLPAGSVVNINSPDARRLEEQDQFTQEFQWLGDINEGLQYITGLYYFKEHASTYLPMTLATSSPATVVDFGPSVGYSASGLRSAIISDDTSATNSAWAIFGELTFTPDILDQRLRLIAGLRYTEDKREATWYRLRAPIIQTAGVDPEPKEVGSGLGESAKVGLKTSGSEKFKNLSYRFVVNYDLTEEAMLYGSISTAYKSGGFNTREIDIDDFERGFDEEYVTAYEIGLKGSLLDRRVTYNSAFFYTEYDDIQQGFSIEGQPVADTNVINAGLAEFVGVEFDVTALLTESLSINTSYGYLDAYYEELVDPRPNTPEPNFIRPNAPQHSYTVTLDYGFPPLPFGMLDLSINYAFKDERYSTANGDLKDRAFLDDYGLLNARLSLSEVMVGDGELRVAAWGKNLEDKQYVTDAILSFPHSARAVTFGEPRSFGLDIIFEY